MIEVDSLPKIKALVQLASSPRASNIYQQIGVSKNYN